MKMPPLFRWSGLAALWALPVFLKADSPLPPDTVLERQVVIIGEKRLILERITPPVSPPAPVTVPFSDAPRLPAVPLSFGCTVYGGLFTEIRWHDAAGSRYTVWSSLDLRPLIGGSRGSFSWAGVRYALYLSLGQVTAAESAQQVGLFQQIVPPAGSGPWYAILEQPVSAMSANFSGLNALHLWFAENEAALLAEQAAVNAANTARAAVPVPESNETLMRFWPVQSVLHGVQPAASTIQGEGQP